MGFKIEKSDFRVVVRPREAGDFGNTFIGSFEHSEDEARALCEAIADQIRRHVDDLPSRFRNGDRGVSVTWDTEKVCEHCGSRWTEDSPDYNGGCCYEDEKNNPDEPANDYVREGGQFGMGA